MRMPQTIIWHFVSFSFPFKTWWLTHNAAGCWTNGVYIYIITISVKKCYYIIGFIIDYYYNSNQDECTFSSIIRNYYYVDAIRWLYTSDASPPHCVQAVSELGSIALSGSQICWVMMMIPPWVICGQSLMVRLWNGNHSLFNQFLYIRCCANKISSYSVSPAVSFTFSGSAERLQWTACVCERHMYEAR